MKTEKRQPWMRFYTADWRGDAELRAVGYAARGLWMDMISLMHEATPYGHLVLNNGALDATRLAARLGGTAKEVQALLDRLESESVFSRTDDGVIYSRRMVADAAKAERDKANGKGGGNPSLVSNPSDNVVDIQGVNPPDNGKDKARARANQRPESEAEEAGSEKENRSLRSLPQIPIETGFDEWWQRYPRKVGKDAARKAYALALKRGANAEDLASALIAQRWNTDPQFNPHPATWLNGGRWQDDPDAAAPREVSTWDQLRHEFDQTSLTIDHEERSPHDRTH